MQNYIQIFRDGLERPKWDRWLYYASRIRHVTIDDFQTRGDRNSVIHQETAIHLQASFSKYGGVYLVPKLRSLSLGYDHPTTISLCLLFINPSLKVLSLSLWNPPQSVLAATRRALMTITAMHDTLKLQEIEIQCFGNSQVHETVFDSALSNFISTQSAISSLKLGLSIDVDTLAVILGAIPRLETLFLLLPDHPPGNAFDQASALLSKFQPNLECLIYYSSPSQNLIPMPQPLFDCCALKRLTLPCIDPSRLDHVTIDKMGKAWRHMESLDLLPSTTSNHTQGISPAMLQHIAVALAPSLRELIISVAFEPGVTLTPPTSAAKFPALQLLNVGQSIIPKNSVRAFVELLSAITPLGFRIMHNHWTDSDQREKWNEVDDLLRMVQRVRSRARLEVLEEQQVRSV